MPARGRNTRPYRGHLHTAVAAALLTVAGLVGLTRITPTSPPAVGDIISFPSTRRPAGWRPDIGTGRQLEYIGTHPKSLVHWEGLDLAGRGQVGTARSTAEVLHVPETQCVLDLPAIRRSGGSFVVEARWPGLPVRYRVHWQSSGPEGQSQNCPPGEDLILTGSEVRALARVAGRHVGPPVQRRVEPTALDPVP